MRSGWRLSSDLKRGSTEKPEQFAALAYDAMNALLESICRAGLNRARIHDALSQIYEYDGVTGRMVFDPNQKNVSPMFLGTVRDGKITYRVARMDASVQRSAISDQQKDASAQRSAFSDQKPVPPPYARVGEDGVSYSGPHTSDIPAGTSEDCIVWAPCGGGGGIVQSGREG